MLRGEFPFCHNCTCYYCFCGVRNTEMFAIASLLYRGSTVVEWQLVYNQLVHPGGMMQYVRFNWQPDHFSLRKMNLQADVKKMGVVLLFKRSHLPPM